MLLFGSVMGVRAKHASRSWRAGAETYGYSRALLREMGKNTCCKVVQGGPTHQDVHQDSPSPGR
jgi:hypothetical protein